MLRRLGAKEGSLKSAALGFRAHSGWTALVALTLIDGAPMILSRRRVHLVETFTYTFRQPYHTAKEMSPDEGRAFVWRVRAEAKRLAHRAIRESQKTLQAQGYEITHSSLLLASGRPLPGLPQILASHALIHTADGELFRGALLQACARCELAQTTMKERELLTRASEILRSKPKVLVRRIADLGRALGPPWTQDEKFASLAAWIALASPALNSPKSAFAC
jgi:hypothetical protein